MVCRDRDSTFEDFKSIYAKCTGQQLLQLLMPYCSRRVLSAVDMKQ